MDHAASATLSAADRQPENWAGTAAKWSAASLRWDASVAAADELAALKSAIASPTCAATKRRINGSTGDGELHGRLAGWCSAGAPKQSKGSLPATGSLGGGTSLSKMVNGSTALITTYRYRHEMNGLDSACSCDRESDRSAVCVNRQPSTVCPGSAPRVFYRRVLITGLHQIMSLSAVLSTVANTNTLGSRRTLIRGLCQTTLSMLDAVIDVMHALALSQLR